MPLHDFECSNGHRFEVYEQLAKNMPKNPKCTECGQPAEMLFVGRWNGIHGDHSSQYGKYQPAFDCVVESYSHKKQLLKASGFWEGGDRVKGARDYTKTVEKPRGAAEGAQWSGTKPRVIGERNGKSD